MQAGLHRWVTRNLRGRRGQAGFTLIELLVVVTILGILAGIVTLSLVGLTTRANVQACNQEYKTVQTALDAFMADNNLNSVTPESDINNMGTQIAPGGLALWVDLGAQGVTQTRNYTRNGTTQFYYSWNSSGRITAIFTDGNGSLLSGCNVS